MESLTLRRLRRRLRGLPAHRSLLDHCAAAFADAGALGVAVYGSLAAGRPDRWSDLDFALVYADRRPFAAARRRVDKVLAAAPGAAVVALAGIDVGNGNLGVFVREVGREIVKVDVQLVTLAEWRQSRVPAVPLHDPARRLGTRRRRAPLTAKPDASLPARFAGWYWTAHVRLQRGDALEALDLLAMLRTRFLLPALCARDRLPVTWRGLEQQLDAPTRRAVRATFPRSFQRGELRRALRAAGTLIRRLSPAPHAAALERILRHTA
ncbi:MAG: hypothetical protein AAF628_00595 [Planctomycetota bacterium]